MAVQDVALARSAQVLFIGGIHGDEAESAVATAELPAAFDRQLLIGYGAAAITYVLGLMFGGGFR